MVGEGYKRDSEIMQAFSQDSVDGRPLSGAVMLFILGRGGPQVEGD